LSVILGSTRYRASTARHGNFRCTDLDADRARQRRRRRRENKMANEHPSLRLTQMFNRLVKRSRRTYAPGEGGGEGAHDRRSYQPGKVSRAGSHRRGFGGRGEGCGEGAHARPPSGKFPDGSKGKTLDRVAAYVGKSGRTVEKAMAKERMIEGGKGRKVSLPSHTRDKVGAGENRVSWKPGYRSPQKARGRLSCLRGHHPSRRRARAF
jgi:hypothetical protein